MVCTLIDHKMTLFYGLQYRSKVSYHPLARRDSRLERRDTRRRFVNWSTLVVQYFGPLFSVHLILLLS